MISADQVRRDCVCPCAGLIQQLTRRSEMFRSVTRRDTAGHGAVCRSTALNRHLPSAADPGQALCWWHPHKRTGTVRQASWYDGLQSSAPDQVFALDVEWVHVGRQRTRRLPAEVCAVGSSVTVFHSFCSPGEQAPDLRSVNLPGCQSCAFTLKSMVIAFLPCA